MPSVFGWVDFAEEDRRRMLDLVHLFREKDTRDELGIGTIRDAFADYFFPGTSTIQTRAKYMLLIPWIYLDLERKKTPSAKITRALREREVSLINALVRNGETDGVIGIEAGKSLHRLPSSIYWSGLEKWGIRLFPGAQDQYHRYLDIYYKNGHRDRAKSSSEGEDGSSEAAVNWHPGLPDAPGRFLEEASLSLNYQEASYLLDRVLLRHGHSLLAKLMRLDRMYETAFPWQHPVLPSLSPELQQEILHARNFSETMHGAVLLYNLQLAGRRRHSDWIDRYEKKITEWQDSVLQRWPDLKAWYSALPAFWESNPLKEGNIPLQTRLFVSDWLRRIFEEPGPERLPQDASTARFIADREWQLKRKRAGLSNSRALEMWQGASGTAQLTYRWQNASTLIKDILNGLNAAGGNA
jgi:hypothetical protein